MIQFKNLGSQSSKRFDLQTPTFSDGFYSNKNVQKNLTHRPLQTINPKPKSFVCKFFNTPNQPKKIAQPTIVQEITKSTRNSLYATVKTNVKEDSLCVRENLKLPQLIHKCLSPTGQKMLQIMIYQRKRTNSSGLLLNLQEIKFDKNEIMDLNQHELPYEHFNPTRQHQSTPNSSNQLKRHLPKGQINIINKIFNKKTQDMKE